VPVRVEEAQDVDRAAWDAYLTARDAPPAACWAWGDILTESYGAPLTRLVARHASGEIAGLLAFYPVRDWRRRLRLYSLRHGFLADDAEAARALSATAVERARSQGALSLIVTSGTAELNLDHRHWARTNVRLPLANSPEAMWPVLRDKVRNMVRKAERAGLTCVRGAAHLPSFYATYAERLGARGVPLHSRRFFEAMLTRSDTVPSIALRDGRPVGGVIFQYGTATATYFQSSFHSSAGSLGVGQFLMWEAVKDSIARRQSAIDMGESTPEGGVFAFKTMFGGKPEPVHYYDLLRPRGEERAPTESASATPSLARRVFARLPLAARIPLLRMQRRMTRLV
jgi:hypothetical protein